MLPEVMIFYSKFLKSHQINHDVIQKCWVLKKEKKCGWSKFPLLNVKERKGIVFCAGLAVVQPIVNKWVKMVSG